ncbi:helix-turn-helix domain-containing protein [Falsiruegeria mediterranea]
MISQLHGTIDQQVTEQATEHMCELSKLAELRKLMLSMERSLGLQDLTPVERDIYYAANELSENGNGVRTVGLIEHTLLQTVSRPTFFRALKSLVNKGYLSHCNSVNRGQYTVNGPRI